MSLCETMMGPQVQLGPAVLNPLTRRNDTGLPLSRERRGESTVRDERATTTVVPDRQASTTVVPDKRAYASADPEPSVVRHVAPDHVTRPRASLALRIRPVRRADHESWAALRQALWPNVAATELHLAIERWWWIADQDRQCLVADENRRLTGFIELSVRTSAAGCETNRVAYVEGWYVAPDARRRGIGRALLNAAESWGRARGCSELGCDTGISAGSQGMHAAFGFAEVARVVTYRKAIASPFTSSPHSKSHRTTTETHE